MEDFLFQTNDNDQLVASVNDTVDIIKRHKSLSVFGRFSEFEISEKSTSEVGPRSFSIVPLTFCCVVSQLTLLRFAPLTEEKRTKVSFSHAQIFKSHFHSIL